MGAPPGLRVDDLVQRRGVVGDEDFAAAVDRAEAPSLRAGSLRDRQLVDVDGREAQARFLEARDDLAQVSAVGLDRAGRAVVALGELGELDPIVERLAGA